MWKLQAGGIGYGSLRRPLARLHYLMSGEGEHVCLNAPIHVLTTFAAALLQRLPAAIVSRCHLLCRAAAETTLGWQITSRP